jgi:hypothetical protein
MKDEDLLVLAGTIILIMLLSEIVCAYVSPAWGYVIYAIWFTIFLILTIRLRNPKKYPIIFILLAALIKIFNLAMPFTGQFFIIKVALIYIFIFIIQFLYFRNPDLHVKEVFMTLRHMDTGVFFAIFGLFFGMIRYAAVPDKANLITDSGTVGIIAGAILLTFISFCQVILMQGMIQNSLEAVFNINISLVIVSMLITSMEIGSGSIMLVMVAIVDNLVLGYLYFKTRNIYVASIARIVSNLYFYVLAPLILAR